MTNDALLTLLDAHVDARGPGVALAVAVDGRTPRVACRGLANVEDGVAIDAHVPFDLASAAKPFTAACVLRLVEQGTLDIEARAAAFLEGIEDRSERRPIRIRDLLAHTSGLEDYLAHGMYTPPETATSAAVRARLSAWWRAAQPGRAWAYSNTNYLALAWIVERVTGRRFADVLREDVLAPTGLEATWIEAGGASEAVARGYRAVGYGVPTFEPTEPFALDTVGDGGVVSTLSDLLRWQACLWTGGIVGAATLAEMTAPGHLDDGTSFPYGLGLQVETAGDVTWCGHGGSWVGTTVMVGRYVEAKTTVIVLSNEFLAPVERLSQRAFARLRG